MLCGQDQLSHTSQGLSAVFLCALFFPSPNKNLPVSPCDWIVLNRQDRRGLSQGVRGAGQPQTLSRLAGWVSRRSSKAQNHTMNLEIEVWSTRTHMLLLILGLKSKTVFQNVQSEEFSTHTLHVLRSQVSLLLSSHPHLFLLPCSTLRFLSQCVETVSRTKMSVPCEQGLIATQCLEERDRRTTSQSTGLSFQSTCWPGIG